MRAGFFDILSQARQTKLKPVLRTLWTEDQKKLSILERYYMTIGLLMQHGSGTLTPATLEQLCLLMAQRMSHLHEFSAPEFFDKNLFRVFIARLREQGVIEKDDAGNLAFGETLQRAERDARLILNERLRHDILRVINLHRQPLAQA